jgi:hypothetical protein
LYWRCYCYYKWYYCDFVDFGFVDGFVGGFVDGFDIVYFVVEVVDFGVDYFDLEEKMTKIDRASPILLKVSPLCQNL